MKIPDKPITQDDFIKAVREFISEKAVVLQGDQFACKKCNSIIKKGKAYCIAVDENRELLSDLVISAKIPYCPKCENRPDIENKNAYSQIVELIISEEELESLAKNEPDKTPA